MVSRNLEARGSILANTYRYGHRGVFVDGSFKMNGKIKALPGIQWKLVGL